MGGAHQIIGTNDEDEGIVMAVPVNPIGKNVRGGGRNPVT